jgi:quercetin dioxygenase-like cupin family protein
MNRKFALISLFALLVSALVLASPGSGRAQTATPGAGAAIKKETLGQFESAVAPGRTLLLARRTFPAGSDAGAHPAPGPVVLYVESGTVVFKVIKGETMVTHSGSTTAEAIAAGSQATLAAGDVVTYDQGVVHDVVNESSEPAVTIESRLNPTAAPATPTTGA